MDMKRLLRKIYLWLSVPFGVIITLVCLSGALMVYEKEITECCMPDLYKVKEVKASPLPLDSLMRMAEANLPDSVEITGVTVSPNPERPYQISLSKLRRASVFIDQYTGEMKGYYRRLPFFDTMFRLHRWLLGPSKSALEVVPAGRRSLRAADKYEYDRRSGEITSEHSYADEERSVKVRGAVYSVHTGSWGGWLTRFITFLSALLGASLQLTGYYLWIRRLLRKRSHAASSHVHQTNTNR